MGVAGAPGRGKNNENILSMLLWKGLFKWLALGPGIAADGSLVTFQNSSWPSDQLSLANSPSNVFTLSIFWNCSSCLLLNWFWCSNWALNSKHPSNLSYHQNLPNSLTNIFELLAASHSVYPITANQLFPISIMHHPVQSLVVTNRDLSWNDVISPSLRRTSLYSRSSLFSSISPLDK